MATTGTQVFEITMGLIDALCGGAYDNADTLEYKYRMVPVINALMPELYQYTSGKVTAAGVRPTPAFIGALSDILDLDDVLARAVLPHGAAAMLLVEESPSLANYHEQKYFEKLAALKHFPQTTEDIEDLYGALGTMSGLN